MTFSEIKEKLSKKTVGIAGCGGLGSNAAVALARVGIGKLIIADFDVIVESNLNRQYFFFDQIGQKKGHALKENIFRINPSCKVVAYDIVLGRENLSDIFTTCDVVIEAFDKAEMKQMLVETMIRELPDIPVVIGSGLAGWGKSNDIKLWQNGNIFICGDGLKEVSEEEPPLAPRVGMVANMQANTALEILLK